jgi:acid phosphatase
MPMGARITFERLTCSSTDAKAYVRVNINDQIVPLPSCRSGPGGSCPLDEFVDYVRQRKEEVGDFGEVCDLAGESGNITFLHHD